MSERQPEKRLSSENDSDKKELPSEQSSKIESRILPEQSALLPKSWKTPPSSLDGSSILSSNGLTSETGTIQVQDNRHEEVLQHAEEALDEASAAIERARLQLRHANRLYAERMGRAV